MNFATRDVTSYALFCFVFVDFSICASSRRASGHVRVFGGRHLHLRRTLPRRTNCARPEITQGPNFETQPPARLRHGHRRAPHTQQSRSVTSVRKESGPDGPRGELRRSPRTSGGDRVRRRDRNVHGERGRGNGGRTQCIIAGAGYLRPPAPGYILFATDDYHTLAQPLRDGTQHWSRVPNIPSAFFFASLTHYGITAAADRRTTFAIV